MMLVIIAIGLVAAIGGYFLYHESKRGSYLEDIGNVLRWGGVTVASIAGVVAFGLTIAVLCMATADEKIEMYQVENAKIEQQITDVVEQYQKYETDIFTELAPESSVTLVALYPELKSYELIQYQIEVYMDNKGEIVWLKELLIDRAIVNWWLYFGNSGG